MRTLRRRYGRCASIVSCPALSVCASVQARFLELRSGATRLVHVRSHTEGKDYLSEGNEQADKLANLGRERADEASPGPLLEGEEKVYFWSEERHVIGDLRAELNRRLTAR